VFRQRKSKCQRHKVSAARLIVIYPFQCCAEMQIAADKWRDVSQSRPRTESTNCVCGGRMHRPLKTLRARNKNNRRWLIYGASSTFPQRPHLNKLCAAQVSSSSAALEFALHAPNGATLFCHLVNFKQKWKQNNK
jgi:hypothetical protein